MFLGKALLGLKEHGKRLFWEPNQSTEPLSVIFILIIAN